MMELAAADGHQFSAYRAEPVETPKGAVVVIQEIFGVNPHIKRVTDGFAAEGYLAVAPALFDRVKKDVELGYDDAVFREGLALMKDVGTEKALADVQAAVDAVKYAGKVAVIGYCWGGYLAYRAANLVKGLACAIGYYGGGVEKEPGEKRKIPTLMHFGETDSFIPFEDVIQFRANRPDVSAFSYAAGHGFNCDERDSHDEAAAQKARARTLFWISQYVVGQPPVHLKNAGAYAQAKSDKKRKKGADDMGPPLD